MKPGDFVLCVHPGSPYFCKIGQINQFNENTDWFSLVNEPLTSFRKSDFKLIQLGEIPQKIFIPKFKMGDVVSHLEIDNYDVRVLGESYISYDGTEVFTGKILEYKNKDSVNQVFSFFARDFAIKQFVPTIKKGDLFITGDKWFTAKDDSYLNDYNGEVVMTDTDLLLLVGGCRKIKIL